MSIYYSLVVISRHGYLKPMCCIFYVEGYEILNVYMQSPLTYLK